MKETVVRDLEQAFAFLALAESSCRCAKAAIGINTDAAITNCASTIEEMNQAVVLLRQSVESQPPQLEFVVPRKPPDA
jgi:hypothetical protein